MALGAAYPDGSLVGGQPMIGLAGWSTDWFGPDFHSFPSIGTWDTIGGGAVESGGSQPNGVLEFTPNMNVEIQLRTKGFHWQLRNGKRLWWGARLNLQDFDAMSWFCGLTINDDDILDGLPNDIIGFINTSDDGSIDTISRKGSTSLRDTHASHAFTADNQWRDLKFIWNGHGRVHFYIDGAEVQLYSTNPINVPMKAAFEFAAIVGQVDTAWLDYFYCWQER